MSVGLDPVNGLWLAAFPPAWLGAWARPIGNGRTTPSTAGEALAATGADAVLDGAMFERCDAHALAGTDAQRYAASQCASLRFGLRDAASGLSIPPRDPHAGMTIAVANGVASAHDGAAMPDGATFAAQLYPPLVRGGHVVASDAPAGNATEEWRAALAIMDDGRCAFAVGAMDMVAFARALRDAGATQAGYTDGGGSARLAMPAAYKGASENRRVAAWLTARAPDESAGLLFSAGVVAAVGAAAFRLATGGWPWQGGS